ncbi:hypothetical protein TIN2_10 [Tsukamurella phage TIN2]|uniref:Uncharacterized protein n=1 Tax=Tsukamurella phage TIN2 TaxID=1636545 RepID=A0A0K0N4V3_9CAUD|nr:head-tail connector protein [Tsukamurella phage TIN2]AKJ71700.1 hypothetical protein TIN2_10 [Tsukamurella phage TIN2]
MADEVKNGESVGRPNAPEPANKTDRVVFSDKEKDDYARFGSTPEPEAASPVYEPSEQNEKGDEGDSDLDNPGERGKEASQPVPTGQPKPTTPSTPKA